MPCVQLHSFLPLLFELVLDILLQEFDAARRSLERKVEFHHDARDVVVVTSLVEQLQSADVDRVPILVESNRILKTTWKHDELTTFGPTTLALSLLVPFKDGSISESGKGGL